jgi:hypothetical protein|uniref:Uncharacterized protein n=1 Tax=Zea mays TaxID=4577 RepID=A0A804NTN1_MAIZE
MLDLSSNDLTGKIPVAFENLHFLSTFNVSNNDLEGPIPTGGQFGTFQNSSFLGNPKLCGFMIGRRCDSADVPLVSTGGRNKKAILAIAFGVIMVPQGKVNENKLTFSDIVKATNNFNKENIIGFPFLFI